MFLKTNLYHYSFIFLYITMNQTDDSFLLFMFNFFILEIVFNHCSAGGQEVRRTVSFQTKSSGSISGCSSSVSIR